MLRRGDVVAGLYRIEKKIARGSMSNVYLASGSSGALRWIVKEVPLEKKELSLAGEALLREIRVLKTLEHPHLVRIVDAMRTDDALLMVTEYVPGRTLSEVIREQGALPKQQVCDIARQLADALAYLHSRKNLHIYRDLKPSNIILRDDGRAVLIDFGSLHILQEEEQDAYIPFGTRGFAAPEQYGPRCRLCEETDIYALGKTMISMLGGRKALSERKKEPPALYRIIRKCTMRNVKARFSSVAALDLALRRISAEGRRQRARDITVLVSFVLCGILCACFFGAKITLLLALAASLPAGIPQILLRITTLSDKMAVRRLRKSARINGVLHIGKDMGTKEVVSWQDIGIPLDEPMTDVRIDMDRARVNFIVMDGFRMEYDAMVSWRENYVVVS